MKWKRVSNGDWFSEGGRFRAWATYDRSHGGDCWKMVDTEKARNEYDAHYGKTLKECKQIADAIVDRESKPEMVLEEDML